VTLEAARGLLGPRIGTEVHLSDWVLVDQTRIDTFARATDDYQWIHVDRERAARESPWRRTIAHGFLTLALVPLLRGFTGTTPPEYPGVRTIINYGVNRVRFMNAVREGARVRGRFTLESLKDFSGGLELIELVTIEIEGEKKPACVAEVVVRLYE
jgi:acyl dehydratase